MRWGIRAQESVSGRIMGSSKVRAGRQNSLWSVGETEAQRGNKVRIWAQVPVGTIEESLLLWDWPGLEGELSLCWELRQVLVEPLSLLEQEPFCLGGSSWDVVWVRLPYSVIGQL